mmetsp:Transcript_73166/g.191789  ORF Transcript_73166/g.191789 Transcript_73166/m.191789 type:complete len:132 (-) Transcript_73166:37-432(-)
MGNHYCAECATQVQERTADVHVSTSRVGNDSATGDRDAASSEMSPFMLAMVAVNIERQLEMQDRMIKRLLEESDAEEARLREQPCAEAGGSPFEVVPSQPVLLGYPQAAGPGPRSPGESPTDDGAIIGRTI